jgi:hypothetical protein
MKINFKNESLKTLQDYCKKTDCKECDFLIKEKRINCMCDVMNYLIDKGGDLLMPCDWGTEL